MRQPGSPRGMHAARAINPYTAQRVRLKLPQQVLGGIQAPQMSQRACFSLKRSTGVALTNRLSCVSGRCVLWEAKLSPRGRPKLRAEVHGRRNRSAAGPLTTFHVPDSSALTEHTSASHF